MRRRTVTRWRIHPISPSLSVPPLGSLPPLLSSFTNWKNSCRRSRMRKSARRRQAADQRVAFPPTLKWDSSPLAGEQQLLCVADAEEQQIKVKNQTDFFISAGRTMLRLQLRRGGAGAASTRRPTTRRHRHGPSPPQPCRFFTFSIDFSLWDSSHLSVFAPA